MMNLNNFNLELLALLIVLVIYWFFNIREQEILIVDMPLEKMSNISVFDEIEI